MSAEAHVASEPCKIEKRPRRLAYFFGLGVGCAYWKLWRGAPSAALSEYLLASPAIF